MSKIYIQEKLRGSPGQVVSFITDPDNNAQKKAIVKNAPIDPTRSIMLTVHAPDKDSRVVVTNGKFTFESNPSYSELVPDDSDGLLTYDDDYFYVNEGDDRVFYLPSLGTWVAAATKGGIQTQSSIDISSIGSYEISLSYFRAYIDVMYTPGSICTCTNGIITLKAPDTDGTYRFIVNNPGEWVVQAVSETASGQAIQTVNISENDEYINVTLNYVQVALNDNSWKIIQTITARGLASSYWSIGDCKEIILNGSIVDGSTTLKTFNQDHVFAELIGFDHNTYIESNSRSTLSFQLGKKNVTSYVSGNNNGTRIGFYSSSGFVMQETDTNIGGWENSYIRTNLMYQFKNLLPEELISCLISVRKYTDNSTDSSLHELSTVTPTYDDLFLLSEYEVFNNTDNANDNESLYQEQYAYYSNSSSDIKIRYKDTNTSQDYGWWLRSLDSTDNDKYVCCSVGVDSISLASTSLLVSPVFVIGG